jgi:hypothetical protein
MTERLLNAFWADIRADCRNYWGKLTETDLDQIGGQYGAFVAALRRRYCYTLVQAEDELQRFLFRYQEAAGRVDARSLADVHA